MQRSQLTQTRSSGSAAPAITRRFLCVLDFEATCEKDPDPTPSPQEIIEFPSILLKVNVEEDTLEEISRFESFVRPVFHPILSKFCTELTSITQEQVNGADEFSTVFQKHKDWLKAQGALAEDSDLMFVTCGDWDLKTALPNQLVASGVSLNEVPRCYDRWINAKVIADKVTGRRHKGMHSLMTSFELEFEGRAHRGIDDCHNLAKVVKAIFEKFEADWTIPTKFLRT